MVWIDLLANNLWPAPEGVTSVYGKESELKLNLIINYVNGEQHIAELPLGLINLSSVGNPVDPPTDPVDPPTDPVDPPIDPVDPPVDPVDPPTDPVGPPTDPVEPPPVEERLSVYKDGPSEGWSDYSWASVSDSADAFEGTKSAKVDADNWSAFNLSHGSDLNTSEWTAASFAIKAEGDGTQDILFVLNLNESNLVEIPVRSLFADNKIPAVWTRVRIDFANRGALGVSFNSIMWQGESFGQRLPFYIDDVELIKNVSTDTEPTEPLPVDPPVEVPPTEGWMSTVGNRIELNGEIWAGRGANLHDTRSCWACTGNNPNPNEVIRRANKLKEWGCDFMRLCLETDPSVGSGTIVQDPSYLADAKTIVDNITADGTKVLVSLWVDPSFSSLGWPTQGTLPTLRQLARTFANNPHVMFGVCNEPENNWGGEYNVQVHNAMTSAVQAIRQVEDELGTPHHIVAVQGHGEWARRMDYWITNPIPYDNVAYEVHVYDGQDMFDDRYRTPQLTLPVIVGEFGSVNYSEFSVTMTDEDCLALMKECNELKIPYTAWTMHQRCPPNLLVDNSNGGCGENMVLEPSDWGRVFQQGLKS